jgi:hypothetical protein
LLWRVIVLLLLPQPASPEPGQLRAELLSFGVRFLKGFIFSVILLVILAALAQHMISAR